MTASRINKADTPRTPPPSCKRQLRVSQSWIRNELSSMDMGLPKERMFNLLDIAPADEANPSRHNAKLSRH